MKTARPKSPLALRIKELRDRKGMTQEELAQKVGIPLVTLVKTEQGKIEKPAFQTIWKIAVALGCTLDEFVSGISLDD